MAAQGGLHWEAAGRRQTREAGEQTLDLADQSGVDVELVVGGGPRLNCTPQRQLRSGELRRPRIILLFLLIILFLAPWTILPGHGCGLMCTLLLESPELLWGSGIGLGMKCSRKGRNQGPQNKTAPRI